MVAVAVETRLCHAAIPQSPVVSFNRRQEKKGNAIKDRLRQTLERWGQPPIAGAIPERSSGACVASCTAK